MAARRSIGLGVYDVRHFDLPQGKRTAGISGDETQQTSNSPRGGILVGVDRSHTSSRAKCHGVVKRVRQPSNQAKTSLGRNEAAVTTCEISRVRTLANGDPPSL